MAAAVEYRTLDQFTIEVDVSVDNNGILSGKLKDGQDTKVQALTQFMALAPAKKVSYESDVASGDTTDLIIKGGSSNGGKSRRKRKSKKARKGKSLRRK